MTRKAHRPRVLEIEAAHGKSWAEIVRPYAKQRWTRAEVARELGISPPSFRAACAALCPEIEWPGRNQGRSRENAYEKASKTMRLIVAAKGPTIDGLPLREAARRQGRLPATVYKRWQSGKRGEALMRRPTRRTRPKHWHVGLSMAEWDVVLDYARRVSVGAAYQKFGIPQGAIMAMLRGEAERIA